MSRTGTAQRQVLWGRMGGFAESEDLFDEVPGVHALMSRILTELADTDGIILDITLNTGGYDEVQIAIASHFVDEPRLPNGWLLGLSNEAYLDVDDNNLEALGVTPDVRVPIFVTGNVEAIFAIVDMMNAEAGD